MSRAITALTLIFLVSLGTAPRALARAAPSLDALGKDVLSLEPVRTRLAVKTAFNMLSARGELRLEVGNVILQTRTLRLKKGEPYAYIVTEDGAQYGYVPLETLKSSTTTPPSAVTPYGILAALSSLSAGRTLKDALGNWTDNAGMKHLPQAAKKAIHLTVDLCPNFARFESTLFEDLEDVGKARGRPVPVTIFASGLWLKGSGERRRTELRALQAFAKSPGLALAIGNHSYSHPYLKTANTSRNFLLKPGLDLEREMLGNELEILRHGLVPAPYFRFPGLVSSAALEKSAREKLSLVVVGKGSWPGLGDPINYGDVVLVHGNGGEHVGVVKFEDWLRDRRAGLVNGSVELAPPEAMFAAP